jgi:hypothetical protein
LRNYEEKTKMNHQHIDRKSDAIMAALATAPIFQKQGLVQAHPAAVGESIETVLASGASETTNTANEGDWIVTNPSGEKYIISEQKFKSRYEPTEVADTYKAKGSCRAIPNPFGKPIEIMASWGEPQLGDEHCMIADTCDADGSNPGGEPYLIEGAAFAETYK